MTLGGLALAVGILVDDATVTIENIERHLEEGTGAARRHPDGASQIAVPALVSTLCICIVFVPMFLLSGVARYLFVPLAEAVVFAMLASYVLSRTLVPTHGDVSAEGEAAWRRALAQSAGVVRSGASSAASSAPPCLPAQLLDGCWCTAAPCSFPSFCWLPRGLRAGAVARPGFLPEYRQRAVHPAHAGQSRHPHRGDRAACRPGRGTSIREVDSGARDGQHPRQYRAALQHDQSDPYDLGRHRRSATPTSWSRSSRTTGRPRITSRRFARELPREFPGMMFYFLPADMVTQILNFGTAGADRYPDRRRGYRRQPQVREPDSRAGAPSPRRSSMRASSSPSTIRTSTSTSTAPRRSRAA